MDRFMGHFLPRRACRGVQPARFGLSACQTTPILPAGEVVGAIFLRSAIIKSVRSVRAHCGGAHDGRAPRRLFFRRVD
ncbi:MAG: hypothetical protein IT536_06890 [Hyphomicrobiales bacterium]|nr:hypothetical protein [Hyphomicrobiales bacterium]